MVTGQLASQRWYNQSLTTPRQTKTWRQIESLSVGDGGGGGGGSGAIHSKDEGEWFSLFIIMSW